MQTKLRKAHTGELGVDHQVYSSEAEPLLRCCCCAQTTAELLLLRLDNGRAVELYTW